MAKSLQQLLPASQWAQYDPYSWFIYELTEEGNLIATATRDGETRLLFRKRHRQRLAGAG